MESLKVDIFKATLWFCYKDDWANWHALTKDQVNEMLEKNKRKEKISSLEEYVIIPTGEKEKEKEKVFENVVGQDSLTRFDKPKPSKNNRNKKRKNNNPDRTQNNTQRTPNRKENTSINKPRKPKASIPANSDNSSPTQNSGANKNRNKKRRNNKKRPTDND